MRCPACATHLTFHSAPLQLQFNLQHFSMKFHIEPENGQNKSRPTCLHVCLAFLIDIELDSQCLTVPPPLPPIPLWVKVVSLSWRDLVECLIAQLGLAWPGLSNFFFCRTDLLGHVLHTISYSNSSGVCYFTCLPPAPPPSPRVTPLPSPCCRLSPATFAWHFW